MSFKKLVPTVALILSFSAQAEPLLVEPNPFDASAMDELTPAQQNVIGIDLRDLARWGDGTIEAQVLINAMRDPNSGFDIKFPPRQTRGDVMGVEPTAQPEQLDAQTTLYRIVAYVNSSGTFHEYVVTVSGPKEQRQVTQVKIGDVTAAASLQASVEVGLKQHKLVLTLQNGAKTFTKIMPIETSGFDENATGNGYRLLTPLFKNASIDLRTAIEKRTEPDYYAGRPFIRITTARGTQTAIAFHTHLNEPAWRGFDSHGCLRVRANSSLGDKDLYEIYSLLKFTQTMAVNVNLETRDPRDNPYPFVGSMSKYQTLATPVRRDSHGLTIMYMKKARPPVEKL